MSFCKLHDEVHFKTCSRGYNQRVMDFLTRSNDVETNSKSKGGLSTHTKLSLLI